MRLFFLQIFLSNNSGIRYFQYFQVAKVSDLIFLFSRFLIDVLHNSRTTVLCCRILIFWSNLALNIVSTARNDLCFTLCFGSHNWIRNVKSPGKSGSASLPRAMKLGNGACSLLPERFHTNGLSLPVYAGLKITDSRLPVMMTGQIFFSPDKPRFWPVKLWIP